MIRINLDSGFRRNDDVSFMLAAYQPPPPPPPPPPPEKPPPPVPAEDDWDGVALAIDEPMADAMPEEACAMLYVFQLLPRHATGPDSAG